MHYLLSIHLNLVEETKVTHILSLLCFSYLLPSLYAISQINFGKKADDHRVAALEALMCGSQYCHPVVMPSLKCTRHSVCLDFYYFLQRVNILHISHWGELVPSGDHKVQIHAASSFLLEISLWDCRSYEMQGSVYTVFLVLPVPPFTWCLWLSSR